MSFFANFPLLVTNYNGKTIYLKDFFRRIKFGQQFVDASVALLPYLVLDGETPESIANKLYGSPFYHWIILSVNNIVNVYKEWPVRDALVYEFAVQVYGEDGVDGVHHYVDTVTGNIVDASFAGVTIPVTNYEYELSLNDTKRNIRVLDPQYLNHVVSEFNAEIAS